MSVDQKVFMGYGKVASDVYHIEHVDELKDVSLPNYNQPIYACKIDWNSKQSISFEFVKHIRNSHNNHQSINMCKEFNEVDDTAAQQLLELLDDPRKAPSPKTNPFTPVGQEDDGQDNPLLKMAGMNKQGFPGFPGFGLPGATNPMANFM